MTLDNGFSYAINNGLPLHAADGVSFHPQTFQQYKNFVLDSLYPRDEDPMNPHLRAKLG